MYLPHLVLWSVLFLVRCKLRIEVLFFSISCGYLLIPASIVEKSHWMTLTPLSKISLTHVCGLFSNTNTAALQRQCVQGLHWVPRFLKSFSILPGENKVFLAPWAVIFFSPDSFQWLFPWPWNFPYIHVLISKTQGNSLQVSGALPSVVFCLMNYSYFCLPSLWTQFKDPPSSSWFSLPVLHSIWSLKQPLIVSFFLFPFSLGSVYLEV